MTATWDLTPAEEAAADAAYWDAMYEGSDEDTTTRGCDCGSCCLACGHEPNCNSQTTEDNE